MSPRSAPNFWHQKQGYCDRCGNPLIKNCPRHKYCPTCKMLVIHERDNARRARERAARQNNPKPQEE